MSRLIIALLVVSLAGCSSMKSKSGDAAGKKDGKDLFTEAESDLGIDADGDKDNSGGGTSKTPMVAPGEMQGGTNLDKRYQPLAQAVRAGRADAINQEAGKILSADANDPFALNTLAMTAYRKGRIAVAKMLLNKAFEKHPDNATLHNNYGIILLSEGDYTAAGASFKKALRVNDDHVEALGNLGSIYIRNHDYSKALPLLEKSYRGNRANYAVGNNYAIALRADKQFDKAAKIYDELVKQYPRDTSILLNYAVLLIDFLNKPKDGLQLVYKIKFLEPDRKEILLRANELEKKVKSEVK